MGGSSTLSTPTVAASVGERRGQAVSGRVMGGPAGDRGRARGQLRLERDATGAAAHGDVHDPGSLEGGVDGDGGIEGRGVLFWQARLCRRPTGRSTRCQWPLVSFGVALC
jgi:hypothetical protein